MTARHTSDERGEVRRTTSLSNASPYYYPSVLLLDSTIAPQPVDGDKQWGKMQKEQRCVVQCDSKAKREEDPQGGSEASASVGAWAHGNMAMPLLCCREHSDWRALWVHSTQAHGVGSVPRESPPVRVLPTGQPSFRSHAFAMLPPLLYRDEYRATGGELSANNTLHHVPAARQVSCAGSQRRARWKLTNF